MSIDWTQMKTAEQLAQEAHEAAIENARAKRDRLLTESDWVTVRAMDTGDIVPDDWQEYRQALRDITGQKGFPDTINWPEKPENI